MVQTLNAHDVKWHAVTIVVATCSL